MKHIKRCFYSCLNFLFVVLFACGHSIVGKADARKTSDTVSYASTAISAREEETALMSSPMPTYADRHSYDSGIYDGATYYVKNVKSGRYLDVDHGRTDSGTNVLTWSYHGDNNQKFKFRYLGIGLYEIIPYNSSDVILHAVSSAENANIEIQTKNRTTTNQKFSVRMLDYNTAIIYSQVSNSVRALYYDAAADNNVSQKTYSALSESDKGYAQWELVAVNEYSYESYNKYYIKNVKTGLYLDVFNKGTANNTIVHARPFIGNENQEWKRVYDSEKQAYYFKPMHRTDMALDMYQSRGVIYNDTYPSDQGFRLELVEIDDRSDYVYRITTAKSGYTKYLNLGQAMESYPDYHYITSGSDSADLWVLEEVQFDYSYAGLLNVNQTYTKSIASYGEIQYYTFKAETASRFKVELNRNSGHAIMGVYLNRNAKMPDFNHVYNTSDGQTLDVFLKAYTTYYVYIFDSGNSLNSNYTIRARQFAAYLHGMDITQQQDEDYYGNARAVMKNAARFLERKGFLTRLNTEADMTPNFVLNTTDSLTGYKVLNSEIYFFMGHATYDRVQYYDGTSTQSGTERYLKMSQLPALTNSELVVWAGCETAAQQENMASKSVDKGARTSVGFKEVINRKAAQDWLIEFADLLIQGNTVEYSVRIAAARHGVIGAGGNGIFSWGIYGDRENVIYPDAIKSYQIYPRNKIQFYVPQGYEKIWESDNIRHYEKRIDGISTNDYYNVVYDSNGAVIEVVESKQRIDSSKPYLSINDSIIEEMVEKKTQEGILNDSLNTEISDFYLVMDGQPIPTKVIKTIQTDENGMSELKISYLNLVTGELIPSENLCV